MSHAILFMNGILPNSLSLTAQLIRMPTWIQTPKKDLSVDCFRQLSLKRRIIDNDTCPSPGWTLFTLQTTGSVHGAFDERGTDTEVHSKPGRLSLKPTMERKEQEWRCERFLLRTATFTFNGTKIWFYVKDFNGLYWSDPGQLAAVSPLLVPYRISALPSPHWPVFGHLATG